MDLIQEFNLKMGDLILRLAALENVLINSNVLDKEAYTDEIKSLVKKIQEKYSENLAQIQSEK